MRRDLTPSLDSVGFVRRAALGALVGGRQPKPDPARGGIFGFSFFVYLCFLPPWQETKGR